MSEYDDLPIPKSNFRGFDVSADDVLENSERPARSLAGASRAIRLTTAEKLRDPNFTTKDLADGLGVKLRTAQRYRQQGTLPNGRVKDLNAWHRKMRRRKSYVATETTEAKRIAEVEAMWGKFGTPITVKLFGSAGISGSKRGIKYFHGGANTEVFLDAATADKLRWAYVHGDINDLTDVFVEILDLWFGNSAEKTVGPDFHIEIA